MGLSFIPGELSADQNAAITASWNALQITAYASGNNLVLFTKNCDHLQTLYLPADASAIDINTANGKIAAVVGSKVMVFTPTISNFYNFNFHGRRDINELHIEWVLELTVDNIDTVNCISWSDYSQFPDEDLDESTTFMELPPEFNSQTDCEFVLGSDQGLKLHRLYYAASKASHKRQLTSKLLWEQSLPVPAFIVKFSPHATCIASVGKYDTIVKLWHRCSFNTDFNDFELRCVSHKSYVTSLSWKKFHCINDYSNQPSVPITPSQSFLKPSNSLIKNDHLHQFIKNNRAGVSENASLYSFANQAPKRRHNVLYTVLHDRSLMIHSTFKNERGFELFEAGEFDLTNNGEFNEQMWITILDEPYLELSINTLLENFDKLNLIESSHDQKLLLNILSSHSELCFVMGNSGKVRIFLISNLGSLTPTRCAIKQLHEQIDLHITQFCLPHDPSSTFMGTPNMCYNFYPSDDLKDEVVFNLLDLNKKTLRLIGFKVRDLLILPSKKQLPLGNLLKKFTGHNKSVQRIIKSVNGKSFLASTRFKENCLWEPIPISNRGVSLSKKCTILTPEPLNKAVILDNSTLVTVCRGKLLIYKCHDFVTVDTPSVELEIGLDSEPVCLFTLPKPRFSLANSDHIVAVYKDHQCKCWEICPNNVKSVEIENLPLNNGEFAYNLSEIVPVGVIINHFGRDVISSIDANGHIEIYYITNHENKISWHLKNEFNCELKNSTILSTSSINKLAICASMSKKLSIWDTKLGTLEYEEEFQDQIRDLDWTSTNYGQGILAVGFKTYSILYTQLRYDYTNDTPTFQKIKSIDISDQTTHDIGDSIWLSNGLLILGVGNQFYISDKSLDLKNDDLTKEAIGSLEIISNDLFHLCAALNGPLPLYHPQIIVQLLLSGKSFVVQRILKELSRQLREIDLDKRTFIEMNLGLDIYEMMDNDQRDNDDKKKTFKILFENEDDENSLKSEDVNILIEKLGRHKLPFMTGHQQITLSHIINIICEINEKYLKVLDVNGIRFYFTMKLFLINLAKDPLHNFKSMTIRMRDVIFAIHSDNRDLLFDITKVEMSKMPNKHSDLFMDWHNCKRFGLPYWLNPEKMIETMEVIAKNEFLKYQVENNGKKDPNVCSIHYLSLRKKQVLIGLWRTAYGNQERDKMIKFLSNDFTMPRWKSAALKNAYVLLGKHRYMESASFFLLAGSIKDSVSVIMKQMNDVPLAIAIAKCYDGSSKGEGMRYILQRSVIPMGINTNDRWRLSWCFSILNDKPMAIKSLVLPLNEVIDELNKQFNFKFKVDKNVDDASLRSKNIEDPILLVMYENLKNRKLAYLQGSRDIPMKIEFQFILNVSTMYTKLGCDWLGLSLIKKWEFNVEKDENSSSILDSFDEVKPIKKPGDILAKFMGGGGSGKSSGKSAAVPSLLDQFDSPVPVKQSKPVSLLDQFEPVVPIATSTHVSLLDQFESPAPSMLESFTTPVKQPVVKTAAAAAAPAPAPVNLLDQWS